MRQKAVALLMAALLVAAVPLSAGANVNPFSDVRADHWAYDAIVKLAAAGLIEGYPDGTFGGDRTFTRYEMAMVFARTLARFEELIEQRIAEGIDAKTAALAHDIEWVRQELTERIAANLEDLAARVRALELEVADLQTGAISSLSDEARAALAAALIDEMRAQLRELLGEDITELAARIRNLDEEVERIARQVLADLIAGGDLSLIEGAEGDPAGAALLVQRRVRDLEATIAALADEFRNELDLLGARVSVLEKRVGSVWISGKNETNYTQTSIVSADLSKKFYADPREEEGELKREHEFTNKFTVTLTATPAENVTVKGSLTATTQLGPTEVNKDGFEAVGHLSVTTPGVLRSLEAGDLDTEVIAEPFGKYLFDAARYNDTDGTTKRGAHVDLVWGRNDSTNLHAFMSKVDLQPVAAAEDPDDNELVLGGSLSYALGEAFNLNFAGVRYVNVLDAADPDAAALGAVDDRVYSAAAKGTLQSVDYSAFYAAHEDAVEGDGVSNVVEARLSFPVLSAKVEAEYGAVDENYAPKFAKELDAGKDMVSKGLDWLERKLAPAEDWLDRGESTYSAKLSFPVLGGEASASFGRLTANDSGKEGPDPATTTVTNDFVQAEVTGIRFAGIETGVLYDRRADEAGAEDQTLRASFETPILGVIVKATVHNRTNDQNWAVSTGEDEQQHVWVVAQREFTDWVLPLKLTGRYGTSETAPASDHTFLEVMVEDYPVGPFAFTAGYSTSRNDVDPDKWWFNEKWTTDQVNTTTLGVKYTLPSFFGTDIVTGYEYKHVDKNGTGYTRNTITASFEKELRGGEAKLAGEGKYIRGSVPGDKRDSDTDLVTKLTLTYPVFEGAELNVSGLYVDSKGSTDPDKPDYTAYQLKAGLAFEF